MKPEISAADVRVAVGRLDLPQPRLAALAATLCAGERGRVETMAPELARRFVAARGALRELLGSLLGIAPADVEIRYGAHGKPELGGELRFNLAHSGELVLIAVALGRDVGVDVELVRRLSDRDTLARAVLDADEEQALTGLPEAERDAALLAAWTRKEALLKAIGEGVGQDPRAVIRRDAARFTIRALAPAPGYVGALAVERTAA
jgi:4'-phosphopantetheinyl transferase